MKVFWVSCHTDLNRTQELKNAILLSRELDKFIFITTCIIFSRIKTNDCTYTRNEWKRNTCIFNIFQIWTCPSKFCFHQTFVLYIYSIKRSFFVLIDCQYALFKSTCSKIKKIWLPVMFRMIDLYFSHRALLGDWVDYIIATSNCRFVFSISKYSKFKS